MVFDPKTAGLPPQQASSSLSSGGGVNLGGFVALPDYAPSIIYDFDATSGAVKSAFLKTGSIIPAAQAPLLASALLRTSSRFGSTYTLTSALGECNPNLTILDNGSYLSGLAYGNGIWVAINQNANSSGTNAYATSTDGVNWTLRSFPGALVAGAQACFMFANGLFVLPYTSTQVLTSTDGINWTPRTHGMGMNAGGLTWTGSQWILFSMNNGQWVYSADAVSWTAGTAIASAPGNSGFKCACSIGGLAMAFPSTSSTTYYWGSSGGMAAGTLPSAAAIQGAVSNGSIVVMVQNTTSYFTTTSASVSPVARTAPQALGSGAPYGFTLANGYFVCLGAASRGSLISSDGISWTGNLTTSKTGNSVACAAYGGGTLIYSDTGRGSGSASLNNPINSIGLPATITPATGMALYMRIA